MTWFAEEANLTCLFHPWLLDKAKHVRIYRESGRWYL